MEDKEWGRLCLTQRPILFDVSTVLKAVSIVPEKGRHFSILLPPIVVGFCAPHTFAVFKMVMFFLFVLWEHSSCITSISIHKRHFRASMGFSFDSLQLE